VIAQHVRHGRLRCGEGMGFDCGLTAGHIWVVGQCSSISLQFRVVNQVLHG
jgi:hypothetical protein